MQHPHNETRAWHKPVTPAQREQRQEYPWDLLASNTAEKMWG